MLTGGEARVSGAGDTARKAEPPRFQLDSARPWPELIYRLVEHYKWEPAHLCRGKGVAVFYEKIRRHEVPLNFLLALVFALLPADTILDLLVPFGLPQGSLEGEDLRLRFPLDAGYTQPDMILASENCRVFIELKWNARIKLDQVQKYLLLHADLDASEGLKRPFLLFLTRDGFRHSWRPRGEFGEELRVADFLRARVAASQGPGNIPARLRQVAADRYVTVTREVTYGFTVWREFAGLLELILTRLEEEGGRQTEGAVIGGFLRDLARRLKPG